MSEANVSLSILLHWLYISVRKCFSCCGNGCEMDRGEQQPMSAIRQCFRCTLTFPRLYLSVYMLLFSHFSPVIYNIYCKWNTYVFCSIEVEMFCKHFTGRFFFIFFKPATLHYHQCSDTEIYFYTKSILSLFILQCVHQHISS